MNIIANSLRFVPKKNGIGMSCVELLELPKTFSERVSKKDVDDAIAGHLTEIRSVIEKRYSSKAEHDTVPKDERHNLGVKIFDEIVSSISFSSKSDLERLLFWISDWWYYHPRFRAELVNLIENYDRIIVNSVRNITKGLIFKGLPEMIREQVQRFNTVNIAVNFGHFALMFVDNDRNFRRIITDSQLFEIRDVFGYIYLDVTESGMPVMRSCCERGGGRVFFDGVHLMSHDRFQTCAPKTVPFNGGYKVNSTGVTIVDGVLYPLIDVDDKVAQTTGAFFGMVDFTNKQAIDSYRLSEESASTMKATPKGIQINGKLIKPIGRFFPAPTELLENGFNLVVWSDFVSESHCSVDNILVVDDRKDWIDDVKVVFKRWTKVLSLNVKNGTVKNVPDRIIKINPGALILDVHFTPDEKFEGLWIANQLIDKGFDPSKILLASSYADEKLEAMRKLVKKPVKAPGKNLERIRKLLSQ